MAEITMQDTQKLGSAFEQLKACNDLRAGLPSRYTLYNLGAIFVLGIWKGHYFRKS